MWTMWNKTAPQSFRRDETGSLVIFSLFMFILILMMSGMAVDLVRHERERVRIQNTIDTAVVAASSLNQKAVTKAEVEKLVKDHMKKAGLNPDIVTVDSETSKPAGSDKITSRWVNAKVDFKMDTMFMNMMGIENLPGGAVTGAREGDQLIEIALVLDTSGSMRGKKLEQLQTAAKQFVTTVLDNNSPERTLISIIPYAQQVHMSDDLMKRLNIPSVADAPLTLNTALQPLVNAPVQPNAISAYRAGNIQTNCVRFRDEDFGTRKLVDGTTIELLGHFGEYSTGDYSAPNGWNRWCKGVDGSGEAIKAPMLLFQNNETVLHDHINSLSASGWTAINYGMNWGVGVLDSSFQNVASGMVDAGLAPANARGYPAPVGTRDVLKYVVLMTDGENTKQKDLKDEFKSGPSRIWYSKSLANGDEWQGYVVEVPKNPSNKRYFVPNSPWSYSDNQYLAEGQLPNDAEQWDHHALFNRFSPAEVADYFFYDADYDTYLEYNSAIRDDLGYSQADSDLKKICAATRDGDQIEIFTIAFEAPEAADTLLAECSAADDNHFDVKGTNIVSAFASIAAEITKLRLTQ